MRHGSSCGCPNCVEFHPGRFDFDPKPEPKPEPDICRNKHGGNPESEDANLHTDKERDELRVIEFLAATEGSTQDKVSEQLGMPSQTCSARCSDLKKKGILIPKPKACCDACGKGMSEHSSSSKCNRYIGYERRPTRRGRPAAVLVVAKLWKAA